MSANVRIKLKSAEEVSEMLKPHIEAAVSEMDLSDVEIDAGQSQGHEWGVEDQGETRIERCNGCGAERWMQQSADGEWELFYSANDIPDYCDGSA